MPWQVYLMFVPPAALGLLRIATLIARRRGYPRNPRPGYVDLTRRS